MNFEQAKTLICGELQKDILSLYPQMGASLSAVPGHQGGRNVVLQSGDGAVFLRVSYLPDRTLLDYLAEAEYVKYLKACGCFVAGVLPSSRGRDVEVLSHGGQTFTLCAFERARGESIAARGYRYRDGAPLTEYFETAEGRWARCTKRASATSPFTAARTFSTCTATRA